MTRVIHSFFLCLYIVIFTIPTEAQWTKLNGPYLGSVHCLAVKDTIIFAGSNAGVYYSTDYGMSWSVNQHPLNAPVWALAVKDNNIFAGAASSVGYYGIFRSTDNGLTWSEANSGLLSKLINSIIIKGNDLFAGTGYGVFTSKDNGANWEAVNNGLTYSIKALAVCGNNLFAGTYWGAYISTDNGMSWAQVDSGMTDTTIINCFAVNGNYIYAGTDQDGIYLSTNNGNNWTAIDSGLISKKVSINSFTVYKNNIFMSGEGGVYVSTNNGASWNAINTGLPNAGVTSLAVMGTNLYAATWGDSVWVRPIDEVISGIRNEQAAAPASFKLEQNYPNPFNPTTTIKFSLPQKANTSLIIYNSLGQLVKVLFSQEMNTGTFSIDWDGSNYSSGIYFYRLQSGNFSKTKKLILLK